MPPVSERTRTGKNYWRSLDEMAQAPDFEEFLHREFPAGASELLDPNDRRHFLKIMGASLALAGLGVGGCRRWPEEKIVPYAHRPEGRTPGIPVQYATSMEIAGVAHGLLASSYDGRPIKVDGNPEHPINRGRSSAYMQASVLDLYDPDRSRSPLRNGQATSRRAFVDWATAHFEAARERNGRGMVVLSEASRSPSLQALARQFATHCPAAQWVEYEPLTSDNERSGSELAFGTPMRTHYHFDLAKVIVSLDSDFLQSHPAMVKHARDFAAGRRADDAGRTMNRLYVCEGTLSLTGANADHRYPMRSADVAVVAARLAARVLRHPSADVRSALERFDDAAVSTPFVDQMARDLVDHRGASALVAGPNQPPEVHLLVHAMNEALGNFGETVTFTTDEGDGGLVDLLRRVARDIESGDVTTLVIIGGNPAYNAPADLQLREALAAMKAMADAGETPAAARNLGDAYEIIHLSDYVDETSAFATWHVNRAHYLEAWGDGRAYDGTYCVTQPLIEPLFDGMSAIELVALMTGAEQTAGDDIVRATFAEMTGLVNIEPSWRRVLHDGVLAGSAMTPTMPTVRSGSLGEHLNALRERWSPRVDGELEIVFTPDHKLLDGRFANNGWLQELPEVMTRLTWDNALVINPAAGARLGVRTGDMVSITVGEGDQRREMQAAVFELPGHHVNSATLSLGYDRGFGGRICAGAGFNAYQIRNSNAMGFVNARVAKARGSYSLSSVQDHHATDEVGGRGAQKRLPTLVREATRQEYVEHPDFVKHPEGLHVLHRLSVWEENHPFQRGSGGAPGTYEADYAWAMAIDLSACIGCGACVVACQAENNIPIVGKDQIKRGREMHWIRVDRYFRIEDVNRPDAESRPDGIVFQPVPCQHCENAPCEQVCPVAATLHDKDGLNVMVYNRCIGTRYCSNNCPYKVRRFNYFDFHRRKPFRETGLLHVDGEYYSTPQAAAHPMRQMQFNPNVTVRSRGVMEKCTYCVQRITRARIEAKNNWTKLPEEQKRQTQRIVIPDGTFTTACAQACPAEAIVFGDLKDPASRVARQHKHERAYEMLEELNTKPRTKYLGKLRNPAPDATASAGPANDQEATGHS